MHLCLFEDEKVRHLYPLVLTAPVHDLRVGRRTLGERLIDSFDARAVLHCRRSVAVIAARTFDRLVNHIPGEVDVLFVNGRWFVEEGALLQSIQRAARPSEAARTFVQDDEIIAAWVPRAQASMLGSDFLAQADFEHLPQERVEGARLVSRLWHTLDYLEDALRSDFVDATHGYKIYERPGAAVADGAILSSPEAIYIGHGAEIRPGAILNADEGPIYVDRDAIVMEGAVVRGPCLVGTHSQVKVGAKLESVCLGPWCKAGGEVHHSILHSYSNKAHDGFLGHAYLGKWCNVGAGSNNSNLKNDYGEVTLFDSVTGDFEPTQSQFVGLFMGDHSKCSINTMFNTGTVIGAFCNLYGTGFHSRYVPSFAWGTPEGFEEYRLEKALRVAEAVMARRDVTLTDLDRELYTSVFEATSHERRDFRRAT